MFWLSWPDNIIDRWAVIGNGQIFALQGGTHGMAIKRPAAATGHDYYWQRGGGGGGVAELVLRDPL